MINQLIAIHALPMHMLTLLLAEEILLPKYINGSTNFRGLQFNEMMLPGLKHMNSVLS